MVFGMILAGGIGRRMGAEIPKQYMKIKDKTIIVHTVETFLRNDKLDKVIVLTPSDWVDYTREIFSREISDPDRVVITEGGELRNDTIMNGIEYIECNYGLDDETIVITHDAVRPFVTQKIIDDNIEALASYTACDTVMPASDTIVSSRDGEFISDIPDRAMLYQGQTPQSFRAATFKRLYESLSEEEKNILTDAAKVFIIKGEKVGLVEGSSANIKITYPSDLLMAQSILGGTYGEE